MINNIIRINRAEYDRIRLITGREGYIAESFRIATQDKFPLHEIHYVFENINPGEIYEVDTTITAELFTHSFKLVLYFKGKCVAISSAKLKDYDPVRLDWNSQIKYKALRKGIDQWIYEVTAMVVSFTMAISYVMLNTDTVFEKRSGKHRVKGLEKSDSDELVYSKLNAFTSRKYEGEYTSTGNGTKHSHEYDVRGHVRHYKSGKTVYVKPFTKCKGRGTKIIHEYTTEGGIDNG